MVKMNVGRPFINNKYFPFGLLCATALVTVLLVLVVGIEPNPAQAQGGGCPFGDPGAGVWGGSRLRVNNACQQASGTVVKVEKPETDGDVDLYIALDPQSKSLAGDPANLKNLHRWG